MEQLKFRRETELKLGNNQFKPGQVIVNGVKTPFTEMSDKGKSRYSDAKIVAYGDITKMKYTLPG